MTQRRTVVDLLEAFSAASASRFGRPYTVLTEDEVRIKKDPDDGTFVGMSTVPGTDLNDPFVSPIDSGRGRRINHMLHSHGQTRSGMRGGHTLGRGRGRGAQSSDSEDDDSKRYAISVDKKKHESVDKQKAPPHCQSCGEKYDLSHRGVWQQFKENDGYTPCCNELLISDGCNHHCSHDQKVEAEEPVHYTPAFRQPLCGPKNGPMANKATAKPNETTCPDCRKKIPDYYAQSGRPNPLGEKLSPARQADLDRESEEIKKNKESVSFPHKFKAAQWTHPNGHPRCKHCGQEERIGGTCVQEARNGASRFQSVAALKGYKFYRKVDGVFGGYKQYKSGDGGMLNVYDHDPKRLSWAIQHGKHGTKYGNDTKSLHSLFGKMYPVKPTKPRKKVKVKESLSEDHYRVGQQVKTPVSVGRVTQIRNYGTDDEQYEVETQGGRKEWVRPDELSLVNESEDYKYSSVQVNLPRPMALEMEVWSHRKINPADVVKWPDHPHVTVKYGIIDEDSSEVREALKGHHAIRLQLGEYGMFPDRGEGDVLLIHVESQDLNRMNQHIVDSVPTHSTYSEYKPHLTLAYVKAGLGKHYLEQLEPDRRWQGRTLVIPEVVFSSKNGSQTSIQLDVAEALIEQKLETVTSGAIGSGPYGVANTELRPIFPRTITCTACGSELTPYVSTGRCPKCNSIIKGGP